MGLYMDMDAGIDIMAISLEMRQAVRQWFSAHIVIINADPDLPLPVIVWDGMSRVQPYRKDMDSPQVGNPTTTGTVRFQVDFTDDGLIPDIRTGYQVYVLPEALSGIAYPDPYISLYKHVVTSSMNSSMAWIRTIETITNTESRPNYNIRAIGDTFEIY